MRFASEQDRAVAEATLNAIERATEVADPLKQWHLRVLRVPELCFLAAWLHAANGDILVPVRPFTKNPVEGLAFSEQQIVDALTPIASIRLSTPDI